MHRRAARRTDADRPSPSPSDLPSYSPSMRARPSLSLLLFSLSSLVSCASPPSRSPSAPPAPAPLSPFWDPAAVRPVPPPTADEPLIVHLARHSVESLVFFDANRVFLTNELGEL